MSVSTIYRAMIARLNRDVLQLRVNINHDSVLPLAALLGVLVATSVQAAPPASWASNECVGRGSPCTPQTPGLPPKAFPAKFNPGFYSIAGTSTSSNTEFDRIKNNPDFLGAMRVYYWVDLEPKFGQYDFSKIESDLAYVRGLKTGKRFGILLHATQFNGAYSPKTPSYMWDDPKYGGTQQPYGVFARKSAMGGWVPIYWNSNVVERYLALVAALGDRFDREPDVEVFMMDETSVGGNGEPGYSGAAVEAAFKAIALKAKQHFPNTVVIQEINWADYDLKAFSNWCVSNNIGLGGPDVYVNEYDLNTTAYAYQKAHHNDAPISINVEWGDYARGKTVQQIFDHAIQYISPHYIFWDLTRDPYQADVYTAVHSFLAAGGKLGN